MNNDIKVASEWRRIATESLERMRSLERNWDSYGADPPNDIAINNTGKILEVLDNLNLQPKYIDQSVHGGICVSFRNGDKYADVECFNTGKTMAVTSELHDSPYVWEVSTNNIDLMCQTIVKIQSFLCK